jgi:signal transduction histidine kinase
MQDAISRREPAHNPITLSDFILQNMEGILLEWEKFASSIPAASGMDTKALRNDAEKILRAIALDLSQSQSDEQQETKSKGHAPKPLRISAANEHGSVRQIEGFGLNEMVSEFRALRASVIRLWTRDLPGANPAALDQLTRFNEAVDQALHDSVERFSAGLDRSRNLLLGILGHDLRSPLGAAINSAKYLLQSEGLSGVQIKSTSIILRSGTRIQQIISDILDIARTRLGGSLPIAAAPANLGVVCQQVVEETQAFHPEQRVTFEPAGDLRGDFDEGRVSQLLTNLVENAIRHGAVGKPVTITASASAADLVVGVHNEGAPIPPAELRRIFEPLTQGENGRNRPEGLGLGLYIAQLIAHAHGRDINVESSERDGTTFTVRLPRHPSGPRQGSTG